MTPRLKGRQWREHLLTPCPSDAAYKRHLKRGEPVDEGCRRAHAEKTAVRRELSPQELANDRRRKQLRRQAAREAAEALRHRHRAEYERLREAALRDLLDQEAEAVSAGHTPADELLEGWAREAAREVP